MYVADCYIHVKYRPLEPNEFERYSDALLEVAKELAIFVKRGQELDYTFEEGTLLQRIALIGGLVLGGLEVASHYHDLRESIIDALHDQHKLSTLAIDEFHKLTKTTPADHIYKRMTSIDLNRLRRIIHRFDELASGNISPSELPRIRSEVIHDLAGLARANPDDPEIAKLMKLLPKHQIPNLPLSPEGAIRIDEREWEHTKYPFTDHDKEVVQEVPIGHRRRYHTRIGIRR